MLAQTDLPLCPVTGRPAIRHVQWVSARLLRDLWRIEYHVDASALFRGIDRFGLWESPTGLYFFDPPLEGDRAFYAAFYGWIQGLRLFSENSVRREFEMAAQSIEAGARVLDVGCGLANFHFCLPQADYTGLDPHMAKDGESPKVRGETLRQHLIAHAGAYDAVCAFQVLEHVKTPTTLFAEMVQAAKPGGRLFVGVPHVPSVMTRIPNFVMNAPPHHLTWWTKSALAEMAKEAGAVVETIEIVPWSVDSLVYWIGRCTPLKCNGEHYLGRWSWHVSAALGFIGGMIVNRLAGAPSNDSEGAGLLLTARRAQ